MILKPESLSLSPFRAPEWSSLDSKLPSDPWRRPRISTLQFAGGLNSCRLYSVSPFIRAVRPELLVNSKRLYTKVPSGICVFTGLLSVSKSFEAKGEMWGAEPRHKGKVAFTESEWSYCDWRSCDMFVKRLWNYWTVI